MTTEPWLEVPRVKDREVDSHGHCSKCGGTHYGSYICPYTDEQISSWEKPEPDTCKGASVASPGGAPTPERPDAAGRASGEALSSKTGVDLLSIRSRHDEARERDGTYRDPWLATRDVGYLLDEINRLTADLAAEKLLRKGLMNLSANAWDMRMYPEAWMKVHRVPSTPDQAPGEVDIECYAGDEPPDDTEGWIPLYRKQPDETTPVLAPVCQFCGNELREPGTTMCPVKETHAIVNR